MTPTDLYAMLCRRQRLHAAWAGYSAQAWRRVADVESQIDQIELHLRLQWATDRAVRALGWLG